MKRILQSVAALAVLIGLASCNPETYKKINYLQDVKQDTTMTMKVFTIMTRNMVIMTMNTITRNTVMIMTGIIITTGNIIITTPIVPFGKSGRLWRSSLQKTA